MGGRKQWALLSPRRAPQRRNRLHRATLRELDSDGAGQKRNMKERKVGGGDGVATSPPGFGQSDAGIDGESSILNSVVHTKKSKYLL